jgi:hypothetical protein
MIHRLARGRRCAAVVVVAFMIGLVCATGRSAAHDPTTKVTYTREIVRLLDRHCVGCHRPGGNAPMPFTTYAESRPWAHAMKEMVFDRQMPPWPAAPGFGDFENDPTLTPFEAGVLAAWADGGAPNGNAGDLPAGGLGETSQSDTPHEPAAEHQVLLCGRTTIDRDVRASTIRPHAEAGGVSVTAQTGDGAVQPLIVIPAFDVRYQPTYRFRRPIDLPKGTVIEARGPASGCEIDLGLLSASRQP